MRSAPSELEAAVERSLARGLVAHYPFEETAPIPDDKLPKSLPTIGGRLLRRSRRRRWRDSGRRAATGVASGRSAGRPPGTGPSMRRAATGSRQGDRRHGGDRRATTGGDPHVRARSAIGPGQQTPRWSPSTVPESVLPCSSRRILRDGVKGNAFYFDDTNRGFLGAGCRTVRAHAAVQSRSLGHGGAGLRRLDGAESSRERQLGQRRLRSSSREEPSSLRSHALACGQSDSRDDEDSRFRSTAGPTSRPPTTDRVMPPA